MVTNLPELQASQIFRPGLKLYHLKECQMQCKVICGERNCNVTIIKMWKNWRYKRR